MEAKTETKKEMSALADAASIDDLKKAAAKIMHTATKETELPFEVIMDSLEKRLPESEFEAFCVSLHR